MKKAFFVLLITAIVISSCKKSSTNNSIIGNWEITNLHEVTVDSTVTPIKTTTLDSNIVHGHSDILSLHADNTLDIYDFTTNPVSIQNEGNYIVLGDSLTLFIGSSSGMTVHYTVSGNTLVINTAYHSTGSYDSVSEKFNRQ